MPDANATNLGPGSPADAAVPPELSASGKYQVLGKLGEGGMGAVYKAKHTFLGDLVAIKVLNAEALGNPEARMRFLREMQAAGQLKHPNIVRALDAEQIGNLLVLVMEHVPGITLDRLVAQRGPLPVDFACRCIVQAAQGLQHAHEKGMVHRDIKPGNLMVAPQGQEVKLLDFGLARGPREKNRTDQTQMQAFMGTPDFVAPEQASDARSADIRADIYSLGCTLYFLLAGRPPFQESTPLALLLAHHQKPPQPLTELRPDMPPMLWAVIAQMLAKTPGERYQTPAEVIRALQPFATGAARAFAPPPPPPVPVPPRAAPAMRPTPPPWMPPAPASSPPTASPLHAAETPDDEPESPRPPREGAASRRRGQPERTIPPWLFYSGAAAAGLVTALLIGGGMMLAMGALSPDKKKPAAKKTVPWKPDMSKQPGYLEANPPRPPDPRPAPPPPQKKAPAAGERADEGKERAPIYVPAPQEKADDKKGKAPPAPMPQPEVGVKPPEKPPAPPPTPPPPPKEVVVKAPRPKKIDVTKEPKSLANSIGMKLALVPKGEFTMGSPKDQTDRGEDEVEHDVEISEPFYMGIHEVTQVQFDKVMGKNPSAFSRLGEGKKDVAGEDTSDFPVESVTWQEAAEFCKKLSELPAEKKAGRVYRLPTEAEWEYACRGGDTSGAPFSSGSTLTTLEANFKGAAGEFYLRRTSKVGQAKPNGFGLYDMHGNVWEWCNDWYIKDYQKGPKKDPPGPVGGSMKVTRGGGWNSIARYCRSASRRPLAPATRYDHVGFRIVCTLVEE
jgi:formylglycine-generating enzyme required for sulfatase activity/serine/threonine protein kinase